MFALHVLEYFYGLPIYFLIETGYYTLDQCLIAEYTYLSKLPDIIDLEVDSLCLPYPMSQ